MSADMCVDFVLEVRQKMAWGGSWGDLGERWQERDLSNVLQKDPRHLGLCPFSCLLRSPQEVR